MKKKFIATCIFFLGIIASSFAQRFQVTTGTSFPDEYWAVVEDPAINGYVTIGNNYNADQIGRLWISSYNTNGLVSTSAISPS